MLISAEKGEREPPSSRGSIAKKTFKLAEAWPESEATHTHTKSISGQKNFLILHQLQKAELAPVVERVLYNMTVT